VREKIGPLWIHARHQKTNNTEAGLLKREGGGEGKTWPRWKRAQCQKIGQPTELGTVLRAKKGARKGL